MSETQLRSDEEKQEEGKVNDPSNQEISLFLIYVKVFKDVEKLKRKITIMMMHAGIQRS